MLKFSRVLLKARYSYVRPLWRAFGTKASYSSDEAYSTDENYEEEYSFRDMNGLNPINAGMLGSGPILNSSTTQQVDKNELDNIFDSEIIDRASGKQKAKQFITPEKMIKKPKAQQTSTETHNFINSDQSQDYSDPPETIRLFSQAIRGDKFKHSPTAAVVQDQVQIPVQRVAEEKPQKVKQTKTSVSAESGRPRRVNLSLYEVKEEMFTDPLKIVEEGNRDKTQFFERHLSISDRVKFYEKWIAKEHAILLQDIHLVRLLTQISNDYDQAAELLDRFIIEKLSSVKVEDFKDDIESFLGDLSVGGDSVVRENQELLFTYVKYRYNEPNYEIARQIVDTHLDMFKYGNSMLTLVKFLNNVNDINLHLRLKDHFAQTYSSMKEDPKNQSLAKAFYIDLAYFKLLNVCRMAPQKLRPSKKLIDDVMEKLHKTLEKAFTFDNMDASDIRDIVIRVTIAFRRSEIIDRQLIKIYLTQLNEAVQHLFIHELAKIKSFIMKFELSHSSEFKKTYKLVNNRLDVLNSENEKLGISTTEKDAYEPVDIQKLHPDIAIARLKTKFHRIRRKLNKSQADYRELLSMISGEYFDFNLKDEQLAKYMAMCIPEIYENFRPTPAERKMLKHAIKREQEIFKIYDFEPEDDFDDDAAVVDEKLEDVFREIKD